MRRLIEDISIYRRTTKILVQIFSEKRNNTTKKYEHLNQLSKPQIDTNLFNPSAPLPSWKPGKIFGQNYFLLVINFRLHRGK